MISRIVLLVAACLLLAGSPPAELPASADDMSQLDLAEVAVVPDVVASPVVAQRITYALLAATGSPGRLHPSSIFRPPQAA